MAHALARASCFPAEFVHKVGDLPPLILSFLVIDLE